MLGGFSIQGHLWVIQYQVIFNKAFLDTDLSILVIKVTSSISFATTEDPISSTANPRVEHNGHSSTEFSYINNDNHAQTQVKVFLSLLILINRPFFSCCLPLFQSQSQGSIIQMEIRFVFSCKSNSFPFEWLSTRTCSETEVNSSLKMAYWWLKLCCGTGCTQTCFIMY